MAESLYDAQIDLSTGDGGVPRDKCKDWMRVRLYGASIRRAVSMPLFTGSGYFINDCDADVTVKLGVAVPVIISAGEIVHIMFNGTSSGMRVVR